MTKAEEYINLKIWAVVGASEDQEKYGYKITRRLLAAGKRVYPVNPKGGQIEGHRFYPDLASLPEKPEIVDLVVPPTVALQVVEQCGKLGIDKVWFQPGTRSPVALDRCRELGIDAVDDNCVLVELNKLGL